MGSAFTRRLSRWFACLAIGGGLAVAGCAVNPVPTPATSQDKGSALQNDAAAKDGASDAMRGGGGPGDQADAGATVTEPDGTQATDAAQAADAATPTGDAAAGDSFLAAD